MDHRALPELSLELSMNGPIAQLVALACHGNAFLRGRGDPAPFFPGNSTCKFCDRISFVEMKRSLLRRARESLVAATPDQWFRRLVTNRAAGIRLFRRPQNDPRISDRMSAGLVGGGGEWLLGVRYPRSTDHWVASWQVWNRNAPEQRIWRVTYRLVASRDGAPPAAVRAVSLKEPLKSALLQILEFSKKHDCGAFTDCFARAVESLESGRPLHGYHKDLCVPGAVPESTAAMLDAVQSAWVFGGMGSWNDLGFEGEDGKEYLRISETLFSVVTQAIAAAANESDSS